MRSKTRIPLPTCAFDPTNGYVYVVAVPIPAKLHAWRHLQATSEEKAVGISSKLEHAQRISFEECIILIDVNFASRHLAQANSHEAQQANVGQRSVDKDQSTSGDGRDKVLRGGNDVLNRYGYCPSKQRNRLHVMLVVDWSCRK